MDELLKKMEEKKEVEELKGKLNYKEEKLEEQVWCGVVWCGVV